MLDVNVSNAKTTRKTVTLGREAIRELLRTAIGEVPPHAKIYVDVPGGGDRSNTALDVCSDAPLVVEWVEEERS